MLMKNFKSTFIISLTFLLFIFSPLSVLAACPITASTDSSATNETQHYYNMLPYALREQFESDGWTIEISDIATVNIISSLYGGVSLGGYVAGFTETNSKTIMLSDTDAGGAINHEIGHYFDYLNNYTSESLSFYEIYKNEASFFDYGNNGYAKTNSEEYFAEAFREYVECAGFLQATCPRTYDYINYLMEDYGGTYTNDVIELTRCESHVLDKAAKALADTTAKAAQNAAQAILDTGANILGTNAPKLDYWLFEFQDLIDAINEDPEAYAQKKSNEWKSELESIDWDNVKSDVRKNTSEKVDKINEKLADKEYWSNKGKEAAEKINKFFGG